MSEEGPEIDWIQLDVAGKDGRFMDLLNTLPREQWTMRDKYGRTLLHFACYGPNIMAVKTLLQSKLLDINAQTNWGATPASTAVSFYQIEIIEMLIAANAQFQHIYDHVFFKLNEFTQTKHIEMMRVLIANGFRQNTFCSSFYSTMPELEEFRSSVLYCRRKATALIRVKRAGNLWQWDKFLLKEIAIAVWATRYEQH